MPYVEVEVDLALFDFDHICDYVMLKSRSKNRYEKDLISKLKANLLGKNQDLGPDKLSKVDQWKNELWPEIREKFTLEQIEAFLNS